MESILMTVVVLMSSLGSCVLCRLGCLEARETNQVGAQTETGTGADGRTDAWGIDIQDSEHGEGSHGEHTDLLNLQLLAGDQERGDSDSETLQQVLDDASDQVTQ